MKAKDTSQDKMDTNIALEAQPEPLSVITTAPTVQTQRNNPLHGLTLEMILTSLVNHFGWRDLAERIPVRCFSSDPSMSSSLKFLRKTPWARDKVESLYAFMLRDIARNKSEHTSDTDINTDKDITD
jgi:uncharacterized protein (DUF2132 family)